MSDEKDEVNEPEDAGDDHDVPVDLVIINETIQWQKALDERRREVQVLEDEGDDASN